jgi:hypothetical protein
MLIAGLSAIAAVTILVTKDHRGEEERDSKQAQSKPDAAASKRADLDVECLEAATDNRRDEGDDACG